MNERTVMQLGEIALLNNFFAVAILAFSDRNLLKLTDVLLTIAVKKLVF